MSATNSEQARGRRGASRALAFHLELPHQACHPRQSHPHRAGEPGPSRDRRGLNCLLTLDLGTSAAKAALLDLEGRFLAAASAEYPTIHTPDGGTEQDPAHWVRAARIAITEVLPPGGEVAALGLTGQMQDLVLEGARGGVGGERHDVGGGHRVARCTHPHLVACRRPRRRDRPGPPTAPDQRRWRGCGPHRRSRPRPAGRPHRNTDRARARGCGCWRRWSYWWCGRFWAGAASGRRGSGLRSLAADQETAAAVAGDSPADGHGGWTAAGFVHSVPTRQPALTASPRACARRHGQARCPAEHAAWSGPGGRRPPAGQRYW